MTERDEAGTGKVSSFNKIACPSPAREPLKPGASGALTLNLSAQHTTSPLQGVLWHFPLVLSASLNFTPKSKVKMAGFRCREYSVLVVFPGHRICYFGLLVSASKGSDKDHITPRAHLPLSERDTVLQLLNEDSS